MLEIDSQKGQMENMSKESSRDKKKILEEEEYLSILEKIVERDFYPELEKLRLRTSYLDALESNDVEKLRQVQLALEGSGSSTQCSSLEDTDAIEKADGSNILLSSTNETLDTFLAKNTSEDNASFDKIMEATREKRKLLRDWMYYGNQMLTLEESKNGNNLQSNKGKSKCITDKIPKRTEMWPYVVKNNLMYNPAGLELTEEEREKKKLDSKQIIHSNTRFQSDPFNTVAYQTSMQNALEERDRLCKITKKVGVDGQLENTSSSNAVEKLAEYDYVDTPSPQPGVDASPLMTWGAIEGTPLHIANTPSHLSQGPKFKIHEIQPREQIAISLADKVGKRYREERKKALAVATSSIFSPKNTPRNGSRTAERLSKLTPAAQKLVRNATSSTRTDQSLRASYTPTPTNISKKNSSLTPIVKAPGSSRIKTPGSTSGSSITDNLLDIPKC